MVLAEMLLDYAKDGKVEYECSDEAIDEEITLVIEKISYTANDLDFLQEGLNATQDPEHELYELWEDSDCFDEWTAHIAKLISDLDALKK